MTETFIIPDARNYITPEMAERLIEAGENDLPDRVGIAELLENLPSGVYLKKNKTATGVYYAANFFNLSTWANTAADALAGLWILLRVNKSPQIPARYQDDGEIKRPEK
jgi:hypothetical protein